VLPTSRSVSNPVGEKRAAYGMLIGPHAFPPKRSSSFAEKIQADPRNFHCQPTLELSNGALAEVKGELNPCHVISGPMCCAAKGAWVSPGGLTRVALQARVHCGELLPGRGLCKATWNFRLGGEKK